MQNLFEHVFTQSIDGVLIVRPGVGVLRANPAACAALGRSEEVLKRTDRLDLFENTPEVQALLAKRAAGAPVSGEVMLRHADGSTFPCEFTSALIDADDGKLIYMIFRDVSARRAIERTLAESEARYRGFFEGLHESVMLFSPLPNSDGTTTWTCIDANPATLRLTGRAVMRGVSVRELLGPRAEQRIPVYEQVLATGESVEYDSTEGDREIRVRLIRQDATVLGLTILDVTERRRAERALTASLARAEEQAAELRLVLDTVPAAVWIARDPRGDHIDGNRFSANLLRAPYEANVSISSPHDDRPRHFRALRHGVELAPDDLPIQAAARRGVPILDTELDLAFDDGTMCHMLGSAAPLRAPDGTVRGSVGAFVDITDRTRAEAALAATLARFDAFMATTPTVAWVKDVDGRVSYVNTAWERAFGIRMADAVGRREEELRSDVDVRALAEEEAHVRVSGERVVSLEQRRDAATDHVRFWHVERFRITSRTGAHMLGGVATDITTQKESELALRESEARARSSQAALERAIESGQRTEEKFRQAQKMDAVGRLAGGVAHDFNNLLTVILGHAELLVDALRDDPLGSQVEQIQQAGQRAATLTHQLLAFSRKQALEPRVLNVNTIISGMERMFGRLLGEDIAVTFLLHPKPHLCCVDPGQIEQVLLNLAVNARDAMPDGGRLTIETTNVYLDEGYVAFHPDATPGPHVMLSVSDTGIGMSRETQSHLFEPFFTTKAEGKGTGLGLSTVYGIVKQSGGNIWVYSEPGQGTTFKVYFPQAAGTESAPPPRIALGDYTGKETILLAEDDEQVRTTVSAILRRAGYHVIEASNGGEALLICEQHGGTISLLITDVVMPRMNGRLLAERLRTILPNLSVLFISGYTENVVVHHGVVDSGVHFLQKPLTGELLLPKVREVLDRAKGR